MEGFFFFFQVNVCMDNIAAMFLDEGIAYHFY